MTYKTLNEYKEETHPWQPFIPINANKLILGTFPTAEINRGAYEFFYPNPNNDFWRVLFQAAKKNLEDYKQVEPIEIRKQILADLKLGIGDIGKKILRQKDSSKDDNLFPIEYTDIFLILENYPAIKKIIITSSSGSNSVLSWFHHYCILNGHNFIIPKEKLPIKTKLIFKSREINIEIITSPSRLSPIKGDKLFEMYRNAIIND
jgi:G:T/U-mismatch repair DNA glycosylase